MPMGNAENTTARKQNVFQIRTQMSDAYMKLSRGLFDWTLENSNKLSDASNSFVVGKHEIEQETSKRAAEAYNEYTRSAQEANGKENAQRLLADAYQNYVTTLAGLQQDAYRRLQDLYGKLCTESAEATENAKQTARQQYVEYLKNLQQIWSSVDIDALVP